MSQAQLSSAVHMVAVRDDVVVLDVTADQYACLVGAADVLAFPHPGVVVAPPEVLDQLKAAGHLNEATSPDTVRRSPVTATGELSLSCASGRLRALDTALRTLTATARFRQRTLAELVAPNTGSRSPQSGRDTGRLVTRAAAYRSVLPLVPFEGLCLQRAYQLRQVLASDGLVVDWVFGVRTWPFFAHCWLQHGDLVVADRIERVRAFTPIAVF